MARPNLELHIARSPVLRYGLAVLSVSVALGASLLLERFHFRNVADPLFLFAIAIAVGMQGPGRQYSPLFSPAWRTPTFSSSRFTVFT